MTVLTSVERVITAIRREREPDRVPWGELGIEAGAARRILAGLRRSERERCGVEWLGDEQMGGGRVGGEQPGSEQTGGEGLSFEEEAEAIQALGMDIAPVSAVAPGFERRIGRYRVETRMFVLFVTGGGFYECMSSMGFHQFMLALKLDRRAVEEGIARAIARNTALAVRAAGSGAHGILVGDDIAYSGGPYASPRDLAAVLFPRLQEMVATIKDLGCVPFFHSDGNLNPVFEDIVSLGFDVIHSLEPSAGMDLRSLKEAYGERVCLMGNVELERLADCPAGHVHQAAIESIEAAANGGGFILSTSSGVIRSAMPLGHVLALKEALANHGVYPIRAHVR